MRKMFVLLVLTIFLAACNAAPTPAPVATPIWIKGERLPTETPPAPALPTVTPAPIVTCSDASLQQNIDAGTGALLQNGVGLFTVRVSYLGENGTCVAMIFSEDFPPERAWEEQGFKETVLMAYPTWRSAPIFYVIKDGEDGYRISPKYQQGDKVYAISIDTDDINEVYVLYKGYRLTPQPNQ